MRTAGKFLLWALCALSLTAQTSLEIVAAYYGVAGGSFVEVTELVRGRAETEGVGFLVGAETLGGDPFPGQLKTVRVYYKLGGQFQSGEWKDNENLLIGRLTANRGAVRGSIRGGGRDRTGRPMAGALSIAQATYGAGNRTVNVTSVLQNLVQNDVLEIDVPGTLLGDPAPGSLKELVVSYRWQGALREARVRDGQRLRLPADAAAAPVMPVATGLKILSAQYGSGTRIMDVTTLLASRISADRLVVPVDNNNMGGDPLRGADKVLTIAYEWNGQRYTASAKEGQTMRLPSDDVLARSPAATNVQAASLPAEGVCFYPGQNYQGTPVCAALGQDQPRVNTTFGSVRLLGSVRQLDLYETENYAGRTVRLAADTPDLTRAGGGFFGTPATWAPNARSFRLSR